MAACVCTRTAASITAAGSSSPWNPYEFETMSAQCPSTISAMASRMSELSQLRAPT